MTQEKAKFYSRELDVIKTVAILFVVAFHFFPGHYGWHMRVMEPGFFENYWANGPDVLRFLESYLYLGVNLFVIASGFGLYLSQLKSGRAMRMKEFFKKRVWRLMPAAIFSIVLLFFVKGLFLGDWAVQNPYLNALPFLAGLNLFSDWWFFPPINGETWFLGLAVQLYLFFPLLVRLYEKLGERRFLLLLFLVSVAFRGLYYAFWKDAIQSLSYGLSVGRLFEFGFGMVLAKYFVDGKRLSPWWMLGLAGAVGYFWPWTFPFADGLLGVGFFALLWFLASGLPEKGKAGKFFASVALQSYLIFLLHHPFIWVLQKYGLRDEWSLQGFAIYMVFFVFSFALAYLSQKFLDGLSKVLVRVRAE